MSKIIPKGTLLLTLAEWQDAVELGVFIPSDGYGRWVAGEDFWTDPKEVLMEDVFQKAPKGVTHVAWYNK